MKMIKRITVAMAIAGVATAVAVVAASGTANAAWNVRIWDTTYGYAAVCKTVISSIYGPLWQVTIQAHAQPGNAETRMDIQTYRAGSGFVQSASADATNGQTITSTILGSIPLGDVFYLHSQAGPIGQNPVVHSEDDDWSGADITDC